MKSKLVLFALLFASAQAATPSVTISVAGGLAVSGLDICTTKDQPKKADENKDTSKKDDAKADDEKDNNGLSAIVDGNVMVTLAKKNLFFGLNAGYMHNFSNYGYENKVVNAEGISEKLSENLKALEAKKGQLGNGTLAKAFKDFSAEAEEAVKQAAEVLKKADIVKETLVANSSSMFYGGPVFGYHLNSKTSAGFALNYAVATVKIEIKDAPVSKKNGFVDYSEIFHGVMPSFFATYLISNGISAKISIGYAIFFNKDAEEATGKTKLNVQRQNMFVASAGVAFKTM